MPLNDLSQMQRSVVKAEPLSQISAEPLVL